MAVADLDGEVVLWQPGRGIDLAVMEDNGCEMEAVRAAGFNRVASMVVEGRGHTVYCWSQAGQDGDDFLLKLA